MQDAKTHRKGFLKGMGAALCGAFVFWPRDKDESQIDSDADKTNAVKLPLTAHKAPRTVSRESHLS